MPKPHYLKDWSIWVQGIDGNGRVVKHRISVKDAAFISPHELMPVYGCDEVLHLAEEDNGR